MLKQEKETSYISGEIHEILGEFGSLTKAMYECLAVGGTNKNVAKKLLKMSFGAAFLDEDISQKEFNAFADSIMFGDNKRC